MTYNDLVAGFPGATYNLLKDYKVGVTHVYVEFRHEGEYTAFRWEKSFSYCLFKVPSGYSAERAAEMKKNNPEFYAFAESVRHLFGH